MRPIPVLLRVSAVSALLAVAACSTPEPLRGEFAPVSAKDAALSGGAATAQPVRWGGTLLSMSNKDDSSCFEVLSRPLDDSGRPKRTDQDLGRFIACAPGFKDPEVYKTGRLVTMVGTLGGIEERKVGEFPYRYPKLTASSIHLWKERSESTVIYAYDPFFNPYTYPHPYYGGATYYYYTAPAPVVAPVAPLSAPRSAPVPAAPLGGVLKSGPGLLRR